MKKTAKFGWAAALTAAGVLAVVATAIGQQAPGGGGRGFGGNAVSGTVTGVDATMGVIAVQGQNGEQTWVAVTAATQVTKSMPAMASDLQVAQTITVMGQPTALLASEVRIGDAGGGFGRSGARGGTGGQGAGADGGTAGAAAGGPGTGAAPQGPGRGGFMGGSTVSGQVTSLNPLTVLTQEGTAVVVTLAPTTIGTKTETCTLADISVGAQVMASGQAGQDGYYYARNVRVGELRRSGPGAGGPPSGPPSQ